MSNKLSMAWRRLPLPFQRLKIGFKKGFLTPTIPENIIVLNKNPLIRILRFLGGLSTILVISHKLEVLGNGLLYDISLYFCFCFILMFFVYLISVSYFRFIHMYKVFKSGNLYVRN